ncbi:MAG: N-acetylneuraminate synthase family protein [Armatimonadota bacterium]
MLSDAKPLFVFEMANNHAGSVEHGRRIIQEIADVVKDFDFRYAFKLQYRHIPSFIHPAYRDRMDLKFVKRFSETALSDQEYRALKDAIVEFGFISMCTPWDERSVGLIEEHEFDIMKVPSCYFTDWPLLERIALVDMPVIASAAGAPLEDVDNVVSFLLHRNKELALMHCVGAYPTENQDLQLNQIDLFRQRYPEIEIGYSTHEAPSNFDAVRLAIAKGATIFEKHVGVPTETAPLNAYSASPSQVREWLSSAKTAYDMCGVSGRRCDFSESELSTLRDLQRGVFAKSPIGAGETISPDRVYCSIPNMPGQLVANDLSKYSEFCAQEDVQTDGPVMDDRTQAVFKRDKIRQIVTRIQDLAKDCNLMIPQKLDLEIYHHYGIDMAEQYGGTVTTIVNRQYCKRIILLLPGQQYPEHLHTDREETFIIVHGDVSITIDGNENTYAPGDIVRIDKGLPHSFKSSGGGVIEEITLTWGGNSEYTDPNVRTGENRKTIVTYWFD